MLADMPYIWPLTHHVPDIDDRTAVAKAVVASSCELHPPLWGKNQSLVLHQEATADHLLIADRLLGRAQAAVDEFDHINNKLGAAGNDPRWVALQGALAAGLRNRQMNVREANAAHDKARQQNPPPPPRRDFAAEGDPAAKRARLLQQLEALGPNPAAAGTHDQWMASQVGEQGNQGGNRPTRVPLVPMPAKYSGANNEDIDSVLFMFETYLRGNKILEKDWPTHAMLMLTGKALDAYMAFVIPLYKEGKQPTWQQFTNVLTSAFGTHDKMLEARASLLTCEQIGSVSSYLQTFRMLLAKGGSPSPTDKDLLLLYWKGLKKDVKDSARLNPRTGAFWSSFEDLAAHTITLSRQHTLGAPHQRQRTNRPQKHNPAAWMKAKINGMNLKPPLPRKQGRGPGGSSNDRTGSGHGGRSNGGRGGGGGRGSGDKGGGDRGRGPPGPPGNKCPNCGGGSGFHKPACPAMKQG